MAQDSKGNAVGFGDWLATGDKIVRIVKISETPKGTVAVGAFVDLVGNGRIGKAKVSVEDSVLVMRADGTVVK